MNAKKLLQDRGRILKAALLDLGLDLNKGIEFKSENPGKVIKKLIKILRIIEQNFARLATSFNMKQPQCKKSPNGSRPRSASKRPTSLKRSSEKVKLSSI